MPSTVRSATGRQAARSRTSASPSSKNESCSSRCAWSSPISSRSGPGSAGRSSELDAELIQLPVEGREGEAEHFGGLALVVAGASQHRLDVDPLVGAEGIAKLVAHGRKP